MNAYLKMSIIVSKAYLEMSRKLIHSLIKGPQSISHDAIIFNRKKGQMIDKKARVIKARKECWSSKG